MKHLALLLLTFVCCTASQAERRCELWNFGWEFHAGDIADYEERKATTDWRTVDLPHDFQIEQPWVEPDPSELPDNSDPGANRRSRLSSRGFKEMGVGWYRKRFVPDDQLRGRRILIDFEGIMLVGDVYLNGEHIGGTDYGYVGFEIDITDKLRWGEENTLEVRADTREANNSRWYTGGGIFRDVHLVSTDPQIYFTRHPLQIQTLTATTDSAHVSVAAECVVPFDSKTKSLDITVEIFDNLGRLVSRQQCSPRYRAGQKRNEYQLCDIRIDKPHLWSTDHPHLYTCQVSIKDQHGKIRDTVKSRFGVRTVEFSPDFGMKLNGEKVLLKGIANHHTLGALGAAAYPRAIEKRLRLLKEFGFNHIRTSHNPYSESLLELCDSLGLLVVDELYDKWLKQYCGGRSSWENLWQHDVPEWVKRDRNHPSVVMWSLGNELQTYWQQSFADFGITPYKLQRTLLRRYDETRPVTVAMHPRGRNIETDSLPHPLALETDIAAYNYRYMYFPGDHRRFPNLIFYQSEANQTMMGRNWFEMNLDQVCGAAYWGMIDYLGESQGWPAKGWTLGVFDISLLPKPNAWYLRSYFKPEEPCVHIGVLQSAHVGDWNGEKIGGTQLSENWNLDGVTTVTLHTYTNCDEVELLLNGKSLGVRHNEIDNPAVRNKIVWTDIPYAAGKLTAIGRNAGREVARHTLETTGKAVSLSIEADDTHWFADGIDLQHIRVWAVDSRGRRVFDATDAVDFSVEGEARIVAVSNGDMYSDELHVANRRSLYQGAAQCILRSSRCSGDVTLKVSSKTLKSAKIKLKTWEK